jgi:hypothetical protein
MDRKQHMRNNYFRIIGDMHNASLFFRKEFYCFSIFMENGSQYLLGLCHLTFRIKTHQRQAAA